MSDLTYKVGVDASQAQRSLSNLDKQVKAVGSSFASLRNLIGGIALGNFVATAFRGAQAVQDLSEQTDFAVQSIIGIGEAFRLNASSANEAFEAIGRFSKNIGEAKNGNEQLIQSFREVGISFEELFTGTAEQNFLKAIKGLGEIKNKSDQARLSADLLGKGLKANFAGVAGTVGSTIAASAEVADSIKKADQAAENFETAIKNLQEGIIVALNPISEFIAEMKLSADAVQQFVKTALTIGLVIASFTLLGRVFNGVRAVIKGVGEAITAITKDGKTLTYWFGQLSLSVQYVIYYLKRFFGLINVKKPKNTVEEGLAKSFEFLRKEIIEVIKLSPTLGKAIGFITATIGALIAAFNPDAVLGFFRSIGESIGIIESAAEASAKAVERMNKASMEAHAKSNRQAEERANAEQKAQEALKSATDAKLKDIQRLTEGYKKSFRDIVTGIQNETAKLTSSDDANLIRNNLDSVQQAYEATREKFEEPLKLLLAKPKDKLTIFDEQEIAKLRSSIAQLERDYKAASELALAASLDQIVAQDNIDLSITKNRIALEQYQDQLTDNEVLQQLKDEASLIGLTGQELQLRTEQLKIEQAVRQAVNTELVKQKDIQNQINEALARGNTLEAERLKLELEASKARVDAIKKAGEEQKKQTDENIKRDSEYNESVFDRIARRIKDTQEELKKYNLGDSIFNNLMSAIDTFVQTGKFKFKDFASTVLKEWLAVKAKMAIFDVLDSGLKKLKDIFGAASGGSSGGGFFSSFFGNLLKSFLPGFANGGMPPVNRPSIVGERGPELFVPRTAGTVVPNDMLRGNRNVNAPITNNYITNNISALDAKSVAQLFAENRKALLGSVRVAEKELPYRA